MVMTQFFLLLNTSRLLTQLFQLSGTVPLEMREKNTAIRRNGVRLAFSKTTTTESKLYVQIFGKTLNDTTQKLGEKGL